MNTVKIGEKDRLQEWFWTNPVRDIDVSGLKRIPSIHCFRFLKQNNVRYGVEIVLPDEIRIKKHKLFLVLNTYNQEVQHLAIEDDKLITLLTEDMGRSDCLVVFGAWSKRFPSEKWNHKTGLREPFKHSQDITDGTHRKSLKIFEEM